MAGLTGIYLAESYHNSDVDKSFVHLLLFGEDDGALVDLVHKIVSDHQVHIAHIQVQAQQVTDVHNQVEVECPPPKSHPESQVYMLFQLTLHCS